MKRQTNYFKVISTLALTAGIMLFWNNCSDVGFSTAGSGGNNKIDGGFTVDPNGPPTPDDPPSPPSPPNPPVGDPPVGNPPVGNPPPVPTCENNPETCEPPVPPPEGPTDDPVTNVCGIEASDILVNVEKFFPQGDKASSMDAQYESGSVVVSLKNLMLRAKSSGSTSSVRMVVKSSGHSIVDANGDLHPLGVANNSQTNLNSGIKIRLNGNQSYENEKLYRLVIGNLQSLVRSHPKKGCVLDNNSDHDGLLEAQ